MPRLTNQEFLKRHHFLAHLWEGELLQGLFSALDPMAQWHLHQYFQTVNPGSDEEVLETRRTVNVGDTALPQQAGRAYSQLLQTYFRLGKYHGVVIDETDLAASIPALEKIRRDMLKPTGYQAPASTKKGSHRVQALMSPDIDMRKLAEVLVLLAKHQLKQEKTGSQVGTDHQPPAISNERDSG